MKLELLLQILAGLVVVVGGIWLGRFLKRRTGVRLGVIYQFFILILAVLGPVWFYHEHVPFLRELGSAAILSGAFVLTAFVNRFFWELWFVRSGKPPAPKFFSQVFSLVVFIAALLLVVIMGYHQSGLVSTLLTTGGVLALTIGLALQDLLGNIIAGFAIHFGQPFKVGDWLVIEDKHVEVKEINLRSTRCRTNDDTYLDIPNSLITKQTVMNLYYPDTTHAMRVRVGVDYNIAPNAVKTALLHATRQSLLVLPVPPPKAFLVEFADSAITYEVKFFINDHSRYPDVLDSVRTNIWYELKRQKMNIPYPIQTQIFRDESMEAEPEQAREMVKTVLRRQSYFEFLTVAQINQLAGSTQIHFYGRDERIIEQGQAGESMFFLLSGEARVVVEIEGVSTQVALLKSGQCFGEMSLLTGEKRSATIVAAMDCEVAELGKETMSRLLHSQPRIVLRLGELLAQRKLENEGLLAENMAKRQHAAMVREYKASLLGRLKSFFEL